MMRALPRRIEGQAFENKRAAFLKAARSNILCAAQMLSMLQEQRRLLMSGPWKRGGPAYSCCNDQVTEHVEGELGLLRESHGIL
jgi:hypothetical protein